MKAILQATGAEHREDENEAVGASCITVRWLEVVEFT
jgi:hypothetical protein